MILEAYIALVCSLLLNAVLLIKMGNKKIRERENNVTEEEIRQMVDAVVITALLMKMKRK